MEEKKIDNLIKRLKPQIDFLSSIKIPGMENKDVRQELCLLIIKTININLKYLDGNKYKAGWWFIRLKWEILNRFNKEKKEPVNRSMRIEGINF